MERNFANQKKSSFSVGKVKRAKHLATLKSECTAEYAKPFLVIYFFIGKTICIVDMLLIIIGQKNGDLFVIYTKR